VADNLNTVPSSPSFKSVLGQQVVVPVLWMSLGALVWYLATKKAKA